MASNESTSQAASNEPIFIDVGRIVWELQALENRKFSKNIQISHISTFFPISREQEKIC